MTFTIMSIRLPDDVLQRLTIMAKRTERSTSDFITITLTEVAKTEMRDASTTSGTAKDALPRMRDDQS